jgi:hypothetical protein
LGGAVAGVLATAGTTLLTTVSLFSPDYSGEWPLVLAQNEGFVVQATVPATGTWAFQAIIEWSEVTSF